MERAAPFVLLVGVSMFSSLERAFEIARRRPALVAELVLRHGRGLSLAQTGQAGHHTVWGESEELRDCVVRLERAP